MRAVLQRALEARVDILNEETKAILDSRSVGHGLMVLLGVMQGDTPGHVRLMAKKTCEMRIFEDEQGKLNRSLLDIGGEMLVVSNFTLGADCKKGTRPSFSDAAAPEILCSLATAKKYCNTRSSTPVASSSISIPFDTIAFNYVSISSISI